VNGYDETILDTAKEYADTQDETILDTAKEYADTQDETILSTAKGYADTQDETILDTAKEYADTQDETILSTAKGYADTQDETILDTAKGYADTQDETILDTAKGYADTQDETILDTAKEYADDKVSKSGDSMSGTLDMGNHGISSAGVLADVSAIVAKDGNLLIKGQIELDADHGQPKDNIKNVKSPVDNADAANKQYVDTAAADSIASAKEYADGQNSCLAFKRSFSLTYGYATNVTLTAEEAALLSRTSGFFPCFGSLNGPSAGGWIGYFQIYNGGGTKRLFIFGHTLSSATSFSCVVDVTLDGTTLSIPAISPNTPTKIAALAPTSANEVANKEYVDIADSNLLNDARFAATNSYKLNNAGAGTLIDLGEKIASGQQVFIDAVYDETSGGNEVVHAQMSFSLYGNAASDARNGVSKQGFGHALVNAYHTILGNGHDAVWIPKQVSTHFPSVVISSAYKNSNNYGAQPTGTPLNISVTTDAEPVTALVQIANKADAYYSTTETFTGKYWINGEAVYRRAFKGTYQLSSNRNGLVTLATGFSTYHILSVGGWVRLDDNVDEYGWKELIPNTTGYSGTYNIDVMDNSWIFIGGTGDLKMRVSGWGTKNVDLPYEVFVEYIKT
jgi:hypothetical protein